MNTLGTALRFVATIFAALTEFFVCALASAIIAVIAGLCAVAAVLIESVRHDDFVRLRARIAPAFDALRAAWIGERAP